MELVTTRLDKAYPTISITIEDLLGSTARDLMGGQMTWLCNQSLRTENIEPPRQTVTKMFILVWILVENNYQTCPG